MYGAWLWRDGGKRIVITEGEIDAISLSQVQDHKWPVVSISTGAPGAHKCIKKNLDWLENFDEVVLMFDMDDVGQKAAQKCAPLFSPGKCKIASLPLKDANEMLMAGKVKELIDAVWSAKEFRPDGIIQGKDIFDVVSEEDAEASATIPFVKLNGMTKGVRDGEVITLTAGSGIGKSAVIRETAYAIHQSGETIGILMLEENIKRTGRGFMGIAIDKPLHENKNLASPEEFQMAFDRTLGTGRVYLYDHFGSTEVDNLIDKIRYMAKALDCGYIFLDHLSIIVSGTEDGDERRLIDNTMTKLKSLAMECNIVIFLVSHLRRPTGDKGHENGAKTSLAQLRGSHAIAQLSDFVIGLERDQQTVDQVTVTGKTYHLTDVPLRDVTSLRVLKNRFTGITGPAGWLLYNHDTGRLLELEEDPFPKKTKSNPFKEYDGETDF